MSLKIVIIDYDIGNVRSIFNAFETLDIKPTLSRKKEDILSADGVILPGVGSFPSGMKNLHKYSLVDIIKKYAQSKKPLLGICLGMQLLFDNSEEFENTDGIGLISGVVKKLPINKEENEKLPHVSWNELIKKDIDWENTILRSIKSKNDMYFVHSYIAIPDNQSHILSYTQYLNNEFVSSVKKDNIYGCQFHPEKSAKDGLKILENFIKMIKEYKNV